ncbi:unnamed protein product [Caenorhabditis nigoni]
MTCTYRNSYLESDQFFTLILHILSVIQFPLHVFGAYVIIAKTPSVMKNVKLPMLMLHLVCASFDLIVTIGIVPVVQFPILAGYPLGFLYTLGVPSFIQSYIAVTFLLMLAPSVAMFFESRYNFLVRKDSETESRKLKRAVHHFANYIFTILVFVPTVFDMPSPSETRKVFTEKLPCVPTEILDRPGYTMLGNLSIFFEDKQQFSQHFDSRVLETPDYPSFALYLPDSCPCLIVSSFSLNYCFSFRQMTCTYRNSYLESDEFVTLILHILSVIQFPVHGYAAYVIITKTPSVMKNVKFPMLFLHFVCASFDLIVTIGILPVVQFPILAGYPLGFLYTLGVPSYVQSYVAVTILLMLAPSVAMFFESRYNFLVRRDSESESRKIKRTVQHFVNYLFSILVFVPTVFDMPSVSETRRIFMEILPCAPTEILNRPGYTMLGNVSFVRITVVQFPILAGYPLGVFYTFGVPPYVQSYVAVTFLLMLGPSVTMFFESRYNFLVRKDSETNSRKTKRAIHHFANYLHAALAFAPTVFDMPSSSETRRIFSEKLHCIPTEILERPGYTMLGNHSIVRITISVVVAICFIQVIAFFYPTWSHISNTKSLSLRTTELQKSFFKALLLQIMVPFTIILIPGCYIISTYFTFDFDILICNMVLVSFTLHGLLSTIIMLTVHKPYRTATAQMLRMGKQETSLTVRILSIN